MFCSTQEKTITNDIIANMSDDHIANYAHLNDDDNRYKVVLFLAQQYQHCISIKDEDGMLYLHRVQKEVLGSTMGPMLNYLTDDEFSDWQDVANLFLHEMRLRNNEYGEAICVSGTMTEAEADSDYITWYYSELYSKVGAAAYNVLRARLGFSPNSPRTEAFIDCNLSMTNLMAVATSAGV